MAEHEHQWATIARWPSGPDGEMDRLDLCTVRGCRAQVTITHDAEEAAEVEE